MMKPTLIILAAGMASRYGSMKQTEGFGPYGETIMDYSIFSAIEAGFGKLVFIIRENFAENFRNAFDAKLSEKIKIDYVYQELNHFVDSRFIPAERTKPWGTGHALLCAKDKVDGPFAVINADDFYGSDAFKKAADFLINKSSEKKFALIGYRLGNTLSEHGTVSRGVCEVDDNSKLTGIAERTKICRKNGRIIFEENNKSFVLKEDVPVSMNFWCFHPAVFEYTEERFSEFPKENMHNPKAEFFIPYIAEHFIREYNGKVEVIPTSSPWFGVTYKEDGPEVKKRLDLLIKKGEFPEKLWNKTEMMSLSK